MKTEHNRLHTRKNTGARRLFAERLFALLLFCSLMLTVAACATNPTSTANNANSQLSTLNSQLPPTPANPFATFRDIPGITDEEIEAIEKLQARGDPQTDASDPQTPQAPLIYAAPLSTELFERKDGTYGGYTVLFCDWLSALTGIPIQAEVHNLPDIIGDLDSGAVDLAGITATAERAEMYSMSLPTVQRMLKSFRYEGSLPIAEIEKARLPRYAFIQDSALIQIIDDTPGVGDYEKIIVADEEGLYQAVKSGEADAFILTDSLEATFDEYGGLYIEDFLPLIVIPASTAAKNPDYAAVISAISKAIQNGAGDYLSLLHRQGYRDYRQNKFAMMLSDEEAKYLRDNPAIPFATYYASYPISFYNEREGRWDGIVFDILGEMRRLTGISFEVAHDGHLPARELMALLENETAYFMPNLTITPERVERFDWLEKIYFSDRFALLSKQSYPNIELNDMMSERLGVVSGTAYDEALRTWFPDALYITEYPTEDDAFMALDRGEVNLVMSMQSRLLALTNYHELSDYKVNYLFSSGPEITMAVNKNQPVLYSILDKALSLIDTDRIVEQWLSRTYNVEAAQLRAQQPWLLGAIALIFAVLVLALFVFRISRKAAVQRAVIRETQERIELEKKMREQLREVDERAELMLNHAPIGMNLIDDQFNVIDCNKSALEMFGVPDKEVFMANFHSYVPEYQPNGEKSVDAKDRIWGMVYNKEGGSFEWLHEKPNGELLPCEVTFVPATYKGKVVSISYMRDLSEIRAAAEKIHEIEEEKQVIEEEQRHLREIQERLRNAVLKEKEANQLKSRFLAHMSHEIRTPMNAVIGMTELALREENHDIRTEHMLSVKKAGASLLAIINDILDFSKIEAGKMVIVPDHYSLPSMLGDVVSIIRMRAAESRLRFAVKADSKIPQTLYGDETRIRQALLNILGNAVKYTEKGFVSLSVSAVGDAPLRVPDTGGGTVNLVFEVTDSGIGIKTEDMEKLFADFTQLDLERNRGIEGIGLGLAIAKSFVTAMGGDITARSEYGKGSTFTITVPQKYYSREPLAAVHDPQDASVLIFEKSEIYADSIAYAAGNLGVGHTLVTTEAELIEKLGERAYDFLFISYALYSRNEDAVLTFGRDAKIIIPTEFGETIPANIAGSERCAALPMPVYCTHLADMLNGANVGQAQAASDISAVKFTAPDAKVLIVDDIRSNQRVAQGLLMPYKMQIDLAGSGQAAIEAVSATRYDLVFMDHKMPGMDGVEATKRIRQLGGAYYINLPIIALTANAISGSAEMFLESGLDDFLPKPVNPVRLNAILEKWLPKDKIRNVGAGSSRPS